MRYFPPAKYIMATGTALMLLQACAGPASLGPALIPPNSSSSDAGSAFGSGGLSADELQAALHFAVPAEKPPVHQVGEPIDSYVQRINSYEMRHQDDLAGWANVITSSKRYKVTQAAGPEPQITTVAGSGVAGYLDGPANTAQFRSPYRICVDSSKNIYVFENYRIRKITPDGQVSTIAGTGSFGFSTMDGTDNQLLFCNGLAVDDQGNVYSCENARIRKITPQGQLSVLAGALDGANGSVGCGGTPPHFVSGDGTGPSAILGIPWGLVKRGDGYFYFADRLGNTVRRISTAGVVTTITPLPTLTDSGACPDFWYDSSHFTLVSPEYLALRGDGQFYVTDLLGSTNNGRLVSTVNVNGTVTRTNFGNLVFSTAIRSITSDSLNNLYIANPSGSTIVKITPDGTASTFAGTNNGWGFVDGPASIAKFQNPSAITTDADGDIYVCDDTRIRKISFPHSMALNVVDTAFSPNGDGIRDTDTVRVTATGAWSLTVDGHPGLLGGMPSERRDSKEFAWDGRVNGNILSDGQYVLRLTPEGEVPGSGNPIKQVIIDRTKPVVSDAHVEAIEGQPNSDNVKYTFRFNAVDPVVNNVNSGLELASAKLRNANVSFQATGSPVLVSEGVYEVSAIIPIGDYPESLDFSVQVSDVAGNTGEQVSQLAIEGSFGGMPIDKSNSGSSYRLREVQSPPQAPAPVLPRPPVIAPGTIPAPANPVVVPGGSFLKIPRISMVSWLLSSQETVDLLNYYGKHGYAPADEEYPDVKLLRRLPPFLCPQGKPMQYGIALWNRDTLSLRPASKVSPVSKISLPATVSFRGEDTPVNPILQNTEEWLNRVVMLNNTNEGVATISWNGIRQIGVESEDKNDVAPTGNYRVFVTLGRQNFSSPSHTALRKKTIIAGFTVVDSQEGLVGFRVINNLDRKKGFGFGFGPDTLTSNGPEPPVQMPITVRDDIYQQDEDDTVVTSGEQTPSPIPASIGPTRQIDKGFAAWKRFIGPAGWPKSLGIATHDWHHLVEQFQYQFSSQKINCSYNLVRLPHTSHLKISVEYGKAQGDIVNQVIAKTPPKMIYPGSDVIPLRYYLKLYYPDDFEFQRNVGIKMLEVHCGFSPQDQTDIGKIPI